MRFLLVLLVARAAASPVGAEGGFRPPSGAEIVIERCGAKLCGRPMSSRAIATKPELRDVENPDRRQVAGRTRDERHAVVGSTGLATNTILTGAVSQDAVDTLFA